MVLKILFICVANAARSQMAQGFARALGADKVESYSAGSKPAGIVSSKAIEVMKEEGVDISGHHSKGFDDLVVKEFDYTVTMGCGDVCPFYPSKQKLDWTLIDPKGKDLDFYRKTRDQVKAHVESLLKKEGVI